MNIAIAALCLFIIGSVIYYFITRIQHIEQEHKVAMQQLHEFYRKQKGTSSDKQRSVIRGQLEEQLFPMSDTCPYALSDMRFIGDFCDYIIIDGYSHCKDGDGYINEIIFAEIKSGSSQLSRHQRQVRDAILDKRVSWQTIRL